jgi:LPS sulfotransferase NodH
MHRRYTARTMPAQPATRHAIAPEFLDAADQFVQLANALNDKYPRDWVRAAMMYATARYNAFVWVTREDDPQQTLDQAAAYYAAEYATMLRDNVDEIAPHYRAAPDGGPAGR